MSIFAMRTFNNVPAFRGVPSVTFAMGVHLVKPLHMHVQAKREQELQEESDDYDMTSELSQRQAALDFFWSQVDEAEDDEKSFYIAPEISLRQAAFDQFWLRMDQEEEDEKAFHMASELHLRQAAFDAFWTRIDQEEEAEKDFYMTPELSVRQAAFDLFWAQLDEEEADEKGSYMVAELSLRQAAFDLFWAQLDEEEADEKGSYMVAELSLRQAAFDFFWAQVDEQARSSKAALRPVIKPPESAPAFWATYTLAGSPSKSIRRAKQSMSLSLGGALKIPSPASQAGSLESYPVTGYSSTMSAMALDLDLGKEPNSGKLSYELLSQMHSKGSPARRTQTNLKATLSDMKLGPAPSKRSGSSSNLIPVDPAGSIATQRPMSARGC